MSKMLDLIAQRISAATTPDGVSLRNMIAMVLVRSPCNRPPTEALETADQMISSAAYLALCAMREPTEAMIEVSARKAADQHYYKLNIWDRPGNLSDDVKQDYLNGARHGYQAAIDEALK